MISAWWLIVIIPLSVWFGYGLNAALNISAQTDICSECIFNKAEKNEESK